MRTLRPCPHRSGTAFSLVELLVVMAIIGILAAMLLTVVSNTSKAKVRRARLEINQIVTAVQQYESTYGSFPVSSANQASAAVSGGDFTYGGLALNSVLGAPASTPDNSEVIAILMDLTEFGNGQPTINQGHMKNPKRVGFLNAKITSETEGPSVGLDRVYRDPWGNPYIITLDLNGDGNCRDLFYCRQSVSQKSGKTGFSGLLNTSDPGGNGNDFLLHGDVMVWSFGQDKKASPAVNAETAPNKDNIVNWK